MSSSDQKSNHRFLKRSLKHATFHNRLTEEDSMWRRREQERGEVENFRRRPHRSRSPRGRYSHKNRRSSSPVNDSKRKQRQNPQTLDTLPNDQEFGPPLPSNLGIEADRWDHAYYMQRYPEDYARRIENPKSKRQQSTSSDDNRDKKQKRTHKKEKKPKRRHRSKS